MKKITLLLVMCSFSVMLMAYPQTLPIDYNSFFAASAIGTNPNLEKGIYTTTSASIMQNQWNRSGKLTSGEGAGFSPQVENNNLAYLNFVNNNLGKAIILDPNIQADPLVSGSTFRTTVYSLTSSSTDYVGTFYAGMLINFTTVPNSAVDFFAFDSNYTGNAQRGRIFIKASVNSGYYNIGIGFSGSGDVTTWSSDIALGSTNYIVAKIIVAASGNESIALYLNPALNDLESGSTPVNSGSYTAALKSIKGLVIRQRPGIGGKIAGLRFSNNWSDIVAVQSTATQLTAPVVSSATSVTANGFTANWTPVANSAGYDVQVYLGANLISTTNTAGQATNSLAVTGLMSGLTYTYKVVAKGDITNFADSDPSTASASFTTSDPFASNSINTDFDNGTWGTAVTTQPLAGFYTSGSYNGFDFTVAMLYEKTLKGIKGEVHLNRIAVDKQANGGKITFPTVNSVKQIEIHAAAGTEGNGFQLKEFIPSTNSWSAIGGTYVYELATKNASTDSIYIISVSRSVPTKFRIENASTGGVYIMKIITRTNNPVLLQKPVVHAASDISSTGFTANWSAVDNATSYKVLVYQSSTLRGTYDVTGQATQSTVISGLTPNTAYTYKVQAIGNDDVDFSDSFLSVASGVTTSNSFNITDTKSISALSTLNASSSVEVSTGAILNVDAVKTINNITVNPGAKLNVTSSNSLTVSTLTLKSDKDNTSFSVKLDAGITATNARLFKTIDDTKWYFMSFPCDVAVSSITKSNGDPLANPGTDWFIKYYDGNKRANDGVSNGSNWVSVTSGTLTAKKGYIFGLKSGTPETELLIPLNTEILGTESESSIPVMSYNSGLAAEVHKGWNLIGQPYLSRFAAQTGSDAPFMVVPNIDGKTYSVKSKAIGTLPEINPMSAYFVQSATDGNINFGLNGRQSVRSLVEKNFTDYLQLKFSNNSGVDDTYLILDDNQSTAYQIGQDMEKWLGTGSDKPQIYSTLGDVKFAFNALPVKSVNNLTIGTYTKTSGSAIISADASQTSGISNILLKDNDNGIVTDLLASDYHFIAGEGINENRFSLTIQKISTDTKKDAELNSTIVSLKNGRIVINNAAELKSVQVYDAVGHLLININPAQNTVELPVLVKGIYNIKIQTNNKTRTIKMMI